MHVPDLYDPSGPYRGILVPGVAAWALGALAYYLAAPWGGTLPALATAIVSYSSSAASKGACPLLQMT